MLETLRAGPKSLPALARHFKLPKRHFNELIASVEAEGVLATFENVKGTTIYTLRDLDAVLEDEGDAVKPPPFQPDADVVDFAAAKAALAPVEAPTEAQVEVLVPEEPPDDWYDELGDPNRPGWE